MSKRKPTLQDQLWGIGCFLLVMAAILLFVYYQSGRDLVVVGIVVVVALLAGLYGLITGKPINN